MYKDLIRILDRWENYITNALLLLSGILILLMAWLQSYGVVKRYIFNAPDPVAYEISNIFLLFCGVLAVAGIEKLNLNVKNDLISSRFSSRLKLVLFNFIFPVMALFFCSILIWKSLDNALYALQIGQTSQSSWPIPLAPIKFVIPFGYTLLALILVGKFLRGIYLLRAEKEVRPVAQT